jgi:hypothetical protein
MEMTVHAPSPEDIGIIIGTALKAKSDTTPRTLQSHAGLIGPSDLGFCRNKASLMAKGVPQSDSKNAWAANVGTAIHEWVGDALRTAFPSWIVDNRRLTATFPSGAEVSGTPDIVQPGWNMILDVKTVDGYEKIKRFGTSLNHRMQRHTYALGAIQAGLLDESQPIYVGNVYLDRSGEEKEPYVVYDLYDPSFTDEIDQWITDVIYSVQHNEDASRDIAAPVCEKICEFYSVCRGALPDSEGGFITDTTVKDAITLYVEGRDLETRGKRMKDQAKVDLVGVSGSDGVYQVRWTKNSGADVPGYYREPSERLDVRKVRR